tara:strand:- start:442 stop:621 length:180 start_codon:yes stop_codon:yes gene_type:complete
MKKFYCDVSVMFEVAEVIEVEAEDEDEAYDLALAELDGLHVEPDDGTETSRQITQTMEA